MLYWRQAVVAISIGLLAACNSAPPKKPDENEATKKMEADIQRLSDPSRALPDYIGELHSRMTVSDGLLTIDISPFDTRVLPTNASWMVKCGAGLEIVFGNSISGDQNDVSNDTIVRLALSLIPDAECANVAPAIGKEVLLILSGH
jgi:hypothetical protein